MGNCCGGGDDTKQPSNKAFQGTGHRLGATNEDQTPLTAPSGDKVSRDEKLPQPRVDENLTDEEREQQRKERLAAVEARLKKQGGPPKKKKEANNAPLTGPNSKPLLTWTAG